MSNVPDSLLMAFVDGELSESERLWLENELARDAALRRRLEPFAVTRAALPVLFDAPMRAPVPDRLLAAVMNAGRTGQQPVRAAAPTQKQPGFLAGLFSGGFGWQPALGYAATLLIGIGAGAMGSGLFGGGVPDETLMRVERGTIVATGRLEAALNQSQSSVLSGDAKKQPLIEGSVRPVLSLRSADGTLCRQYQLIGRNRKDAGGLACRDDNGQWRITVMSNSASTGTTQQVSGGGSDVGTDPIVSDAVKNLGRSETLTVDEESFLIERGWAAPQSAPAKEPPAN